jgi:hypothetical protein
MLASRLPRVPPVISAFLPERSKSLGAANGGVGSMQNERSDERLVDPWGENGLYLYQTV